MSTPAALGRCEFRGCPIRFRDGQDRMCVDHAGEELAVMAAARELGIDLAAIQAAAPGQRDGDTTPATPGW